MDRYETSWRQILNTFIFYKTKKTNLLTYLLTDLLTYLPSAILAPDKVMCGCAMQYTVYL